MKTRKATKLIYKNLGIPLITFKLADGTEGEALIDTGSESSLFDKAFVKDHKSQFKIVNTGQKMEQIAFGGKTTTPIIKLTVSFYLKTYRGKKLFASIIEDALLSDLSIVNKDIAEARNVNNAFQAIIGTDILKKLHADINYENNTIIFDSEKQH